MDTAGTTSFDIEAQGLCKSFGILQALRGVDLNVANGSTLAIFGPNGAGKTTLIKILASVMRPSSGRVLIDGLGLKDNAETLRGRIGLLSHQSYIYGSLSAQENLEFYGKMYGVVNAKSRIAEMLSKVGLTARRHDRVATFSRGMQQRLALARVLLHRPSILLMDEPETGLDQQALASVWDIIRSDAVHRTIIFTSHSFERALGVCDEAAVMEKGRIAFIERRCKLDLELLRQAYNTCTGARP